MRTCARLEYPVRVTGIPYTLRYADRTNIASAICEQKNTEESTLAMATLRIDLDRFKKSHWTTEEIGNAKIISDFVQKLMNDHDFDYVLENYANDSYVQHNRNIADGIEGLVEVVRQFTKRFPDYCYDVKQILVDGDQVVFHSHATMKRTDRGNDKKGLNIMDNWKIRDGKIVEHWDTLQPIDGFMRLYVLLNGGKIRNANGVF